MRFSIGTEQWHTIPFSLKTGKTVWSVGTDGHLLLAVKLSGATFRKDYPEDLPNMLTKPAVNFVEIKLEELKRWAGQAPMLLIPSGDVLFENQGVLLDHIIDRRKLAYLFARITTPVVRAWVVKPGVLGFEQPNRQWRAFLATCKDKPDGDEPVFQAEAEKSALEIAEEAVGAE
jgi:hypothetical protein